MPTPADFLGKLVFVKVDYQHSTPVPSGTHMFHGTFGDKTMYNTDSETSAPFEGDQIVSIVKVSDLIGKKVSVGVDFNQSPYNPLPELPWSYTGTFGVIPGSSTYFTLDQTSPPFIGDWVTEIDLVAEDPPGGGES